MTERESTRRVQSDDEKEGRSSSRKSMVESAAHVTPVQIFEAAGSFVAVAAASFFRGARAPPLTERPRQRIRRVRRAVAPPGTLLVCARPQTVDHTHRRQQKGDGSGGLDTRVDAQSVLRHLEQALLLLRVDFHLA